MHRKAKVSATIGWILALPHIPGSGLQKGSWNNSIRFTMDLLPWCRLQPGFVAPLFSLTDALAETKVPVCARHYEECKHPQDTKNRVGKTKYSIVNIIRKLSRASPCGIESNGDPRKKSICDRFRSREGTSQGRSGLHGAALRPSGLPGRALGNLFSQHNHCERPLHSHLDNKQQWSHDF